MQRVLFDASVYIESLRTQDQALIQTRTVVPGTVLWLSSVVLEELYAGSKRNSIRIIEKLERDFKTVGRVLTPDVGDWVGAGRILAKIGAKYGFDQPFDRWKNTVDTEKLIKNIYADRLISTRPKPALKRSKRPLASKPL